MSELAARCVRVNDASENFGCKGRTPYSQELVLRDRFLTGPGMAVAFPPANEDGNSGDETISEESLSLLCPDDTDRAPWRPVLFPGPETHSNLHICTGSSAYGDYARRPRSRVSSVSYRFGC